MRKISKKVIAILLALVMVLSFAACGSSESSTTVVVDDDGNETEVAVTKIVMANHLVGEAATADYWLEIEKDFEAAYPQYDLEYYIAGYNDMVSNVTTTVAGGGQIDIILGESAWVSTLADSYIISPATDVMSTAFMNEIYDYLLPAFEYEGDTYGFPLYYTNNLFFYNTEMAIEAGLDINNTPTTEEELWVWMDALSTLTTSTGESVYPIGLPYAEATTPGLFMNSLMTAFGTTVIDDNAQLSVDNDAFYEFIDFMVELDDKGYNPQATLPKDLRNMFATGQVAMFMDQSWGISGSVAVDPDVYSYTGTFAVPAMGSTGEGATLVSAHSLMVTGLNDETYEGTATFIEWLMTTEVMGEHMETINPALSESTAAMSDYEPLYIFEGVGDGASNIVTQVAHPQLTSVQTDICTMLNAIILNGKSIEQAVSEFTTEANILLK